jgi:hypothetical protein
MRRFAVPPLLVLLAIALLLAACDAGSRPFRHEGDGGSRLAAPPEGLSVLVEPITGMPEGTAVAGAMATALRLAEVPASTAFGADAGYRLYGVPDGAEVTWRLAATDGRQLAAARSPAATTDPDAPEAGFHVAAAALARAIRAHQTADLPDGAAVERSPRLFLAPATGAPGDGDRALPLAMRRALSETRLELLDSAAPEAFMLEPQVRLGPAADGRQPIEILWVLSRDGAEVGRLAQRNAVPAGSLDERWGATAALAARAAAPGVSALLAEALR